MKKSIILIGSGGHCESLIDVLEDHGGYHILGFWDPQSNRNSLCDYVRLQDYHSLESVVPASHCLMVAVGQVKSPDIRIGLFNTIKQAGGKLPVLISPRAYVSARATLGEGTVVMPGASINAGVAVGRNCIINSHAVIEHGVSIDDHCHVSTGAVANGNCIVESGTFIGSNATIRQGVRVAPYNVVGAGTVILNDTSPGCTYVGNPARKINDPSTG